MTIKDVEERTGLSRSNIRFYEKEKLIEPSRNESNGYRDYSKNDVENIKKIAYLRTLGISIEDIRSIISEKVTLQEMLEKHKEVLKNQMTIGKIIELFSNWIPSAFCIYGEVCLPGLYLPHYV